MRPPANGVWIREDVWKLPPWDPTLLWYARAVDRMWSLPLSDSKGWRYQAAIHEYVRQFDPEKTPNDSLPSAQEQLRFWTQCQHGSWYFLPWHRIYLACFEQIVRQHVVALGGPSDWALPYWNYSDTNNPDALKVRPEFIQATLPDGSPNALARAERGRTPALAIQGAATGDFGIRPAHADLACLLIQPFESVGGAAGFGGPKTGFEHGGNVIGDLEGTPHGAIHMAVGGWLGGFNTAGLDPLFWLHHCNIDRLWEVWKNRDPSFKDPTDPSWGAPLGTPFELNDAAGGTKTVTSDLLVDTTASPMWYRYEDISDPLATAGLSQEDISVRTGPASLVGASETSTRLASTPTTTRVRMDPEASQDTSLALGGEPERAYLNIENIVGLEPSASYRVYVNSKGDDRGYAGLLPMFGLVERSGRGDPHGGNGLTYVLDITRLVQELKQRGEWDSEGFEVTFVPDDEGTSEGRGPRVGRVSLYFR
jgi:tyrosinase